MQFLILDGIVKEKVIPVTSFLVPVVTYEGENVIDELDINKSSEPNSIPMCILKAGLPHLLKLLKMLKTCFFEKLLKLLKMLENNMLFK